MFFVFLRWPLLDSIRPHGIFVFRLLLSKLCLSLSWVVWTGPLRSPAKYAVRVVACRGVSWRQELAGECGSQALNPNELGAVLKVLSLLAAELELDAGGNLSTVRTVIGISG